MTRYLFTSVAIIGAIALAGVAPMNAATAQTRSTVSNQPIMIGADGGERTATSFSLRGRAEVVQGDNRLRADAIQGANSAGGGIATVTASGNVYYVTPNETLRGDRAVYDVSAATIVITGDVILTQGKNVLTGGRLTYNIDTGSADMAGGSNSRIQGVFYPQGSAN